MAIVEVKDLFKRYGDVVAVDHIEFMVAPGEVFGILGPNGAGKTTTLEIIEGLRHPDAGRVVVDGIDVQRSPREVRSRIGMQLQQAGFFDRLTVDETLQFFSAFHRRVLPVADVIHRLREDVLPLLRDGRITVPVEETFPLDQAQQAYERFAAGGKFGKIVIVP